MDSSSLLTLGVLDTKINSSECPVIPGSFLAASIYMSLPLSNWRWAVGSSSVRLNLKLSSECYFVFTIFSPPQETRGKSGFFLDWKKIKYIEYFKIIML